MVLSEIDRNLLERCLTRKPRAWEDFVDRFMGLVIHVINHTAQARSVRLSPEDREDLCAEVFLNLLKEDFRILRHFRGQSSLATYLTVVARRIVVRALLQRKSPSPLTDRSSSGSQETLPDTRSPGADRLEDVEQVEELLKGLEGREADVVRMYHLESKSYREISAATGISENSIGPILSRARSKLRRTGTNPSTT